jgi:D-alanyl-D-alanine carboxypeptidase
VLGEYTSRDRSLRAASLLEHGFRHYGWKELFAGATVDTVPVSAETSVVRSVRELVASFACNGKRHARSVPTRRKKKRARTKKSATTAAAKRGRAANRAEARSASQAGNSGKRN